VNFAGKVLGIEQSNLDRVLKDLKAMREAERITMNERDASERTEYEENLRVATDEADLSALLAVSCARE